jgi:hypothetical protein
MSHNEVVLSPDSSHPDRQAGSKKAGPFTLPLSAKYTVVPDDRAEPLTVPAGAADDGAADEAAADGTGLNVTDVDAASVGAGELRAGEEVAAVLPRVEDALEQPSKASAAANGKISATVRDKGTGSPTWMGAES